MRTLIRTESDLTVFVDGLKNLRLGQMASMFNKTIKHPEAKASVERAVGQKASKTITDRQARDLAAQETLRAKSAERKLEQESQKLRAAQADLSRLSMSISQTDTSRASAANSVSAPARSTSNSPVNNPVTLF